MIRTWTLIGLVGCLATAPAFATSIAASLDALGRSIKGSSDATSDVSSSGSTRDNKVVKAARDDAASYVATSGRIRGPRLEQAFQQLRSGPQGLKGSDDELAQAIMLIN